LFQGTVEITGKDTRHLPQKSTQDTTV